MTSGKKINKNKMTFTHISILTSLLFAPSFLLSLHYYDLKDVTFFYLLIITVYLLIALLLRQNFKTIATPFIYFCFLLSGYIFNYLEFIKIIPALISFGFFSLFFTSFVQKKEIILSLTQKFYTKELSNAKVKHLAQSDGYWAFVLFMNTSIQVFLAFSDNNELWAFYSSVGWYIFMFFALTLQLIYEKIYVSDTQEETLS